LLSLAKVRDECLVTFDNIANVFKVSTPMGLMTFKADRSLYVCNVNTDVEDKQGEVVSLFSAIDMRKQRFTPREVKAAEEARDLQKKLGYPSTDALVKLLQSGGVVNAPCSSADV
jgi:hypothetical protein